jgi:glycerol uptake facilitator-like aquaporin
VHADRQLTIQPASGHLEEELVRKVLRRIAITIVGTALAAGLLVAVPTQASAGQSASCRVVRTSCTSGTIRAHATGHHINIYVDTGMRGAHYYLWDYDNGNLVASGYVGRNSHLWRWVRGLYGQYAIQLTDSAWDSYARIDNN